MGNNDAIDAIEKARSLLAKDDFNGGQSGKAEVTIPRIDPKVREN